MGSVICWAATRSEPKIGRLRGSPPFFRQFPSNPSVFHLNRGRREESTVEEALN